MSMVLALMLAAPAPAPAPAPVATAPVEAVDAARLTAARALIEAMMPAARRDAQMREMLAPMMANVRQAIETSPQLADLLTSQPEARAKMLVFLDRQLTASVETTLAGMPGLIDAMAVAYARQFTVAQLNEVGAFYATPTGRALVAALPKVMGDPAVATAQRAMMARAMVRVQADTAQLVRELAELRGQQPALPN